MSLNLHPMINLAIKAARAAGNIINRAALDLAYVAAGYTDGFFERGLQPWDVAAGSLLVTEAGGLVGNFTGEADFLDQQECVAGAPRVYGQLVGILGKHSKFASAGEKAAVRQTLSAPTP